MPALATGAGVCSEAEGPAGCHALDPKGNPCPFAPRSTPLRPSPPPPLNPPHTPPQPRREQHQHREPQIRPTPPGLPALAATLDRMPRHPQRVQHEVPRDQHRQQADHADHDRPDRTVRMFDAVRVRTVETLDRRRFQRRFGSIRSVAIARPHPRIAGDTLKRRNEMRRDSHLVSSHSPWCHPTEFACFRSVVRAG